MIQQFSAALLVSAAGLLGTITDAPARSLDENSPFLPPSRVETAQKAEKRKQPSPAHSGRFVLRGISKIGSTYLFSIYDSQTKKAKWVEAGSSANGFSITSYDPKTRTISYRWNGHESTLPLVNADDMATPLTFVSAGGSAIDGQSSPRRVAPPDAPHRVNQSQRSGSGRISGQGNPTEPTQQSLQTIFFDSAGYRSNRSGSANTNPTDLGDNGFASDDSFADPEPQAPVDTPEASEATPQQRFKISRRNNVSNANGKKPDHMSWSAWTALKNSQ